MTLTIADAFFFVALVLFVIEFLQSRSLSSAAFACISLGFILLT